MSRLGGARSWLAGPRLLLLLYVVGGSGLAVTVATAEPDIIYWMSVDELLARSARYRSKRLRLEGVLVSGSLVRHEDCEYRFRLSSNGAEIPVRWRAGQEGDVCTSPWIICEVPNEARRITADGYLEGADERLGFVAQHFGVRFVRVEDLPDPKKIPCLPVPTARRDR